MFLLDFGCGPLGVLRILLFIKLIMNIIFAIVPIGLIIFISIDYSKAMLAGDPDKAKEKANISLKRMIYAVILFAIPWIVGAFNTLLGDLGVDYAVCLELADNNEYIKTLEEEEKLEQDAIASARAEVLQRKLEKMEEAEAAKITARQNVTSSSSNTIKASGCDGVIYYENGTFYKPSSNLVPNNGVDETMGSAEYGYNKYFYELLQTFVEAGKKAGYTITPSHTYYGAWRPFVVQQYFKCLQDGSYKPVTVPEKFRDSGNGYYCSGASGGNTAATPGGSNHGWGIASDLDYHNNTAAANWANANAKKYNLNFSVGGENWHIEPLSVSINDEKVKKCL